MIKWIRTGKTVNEEGTTIVYTNSKIDLVIESRKRHVPHASRSGFWDHTTYYVIHPNRTEREFYSLTDAKEFAEKIAGGEISWPR